MSDLSQRRALVTGASAGIGEATARALAAAGARVTLAARRFERVQAIAAELDGAEALALDVTDSAAVTAALAGREFDLVVANAGLARGVEPLQEGDPAEWSEVIDTNVKGVLNTVRATLQPMLDAGRGDVILLGSVAGRQVYPGGAVYCASKHAVRAIYEGLRQDAGGRGVRFSTVDPGMVKTDFSRVRFRGDEQRAAAVYDGVDALTPEDVAESIVWIATRPQRVNVGELVLWASAQSSTTKLTRR
ncbi:SDR family NAD(P)-dependent oxidoreductase [Engelhardtia mirabilis]|uniref:Serine 3-dehydrogenase n=1 Tax=Engelhardtia mirabilis TaxID=2528011 RepID=A0A518BJT6_9BACT|nr:Serine 3-dehydrogenase [Planctomycetes bacterium Pla133]QDV01561.1 Serine 3-dehydrogenase [Planctomycetes bacterium Pla86]